MNTYHKFCPNVFLAKCDEKHEKGEVIEVTTKYGKENESIVFNLIFEKDGFYYYSIVRADGFNVHERVAKYWEKRAETINLSMPESIDFYEHKLEQAKEFHEGVKSGKYPREHAYTLTYAKKAVNEAQKNYELALKLWGDEE